MNTQVENQSGSLGVTSVIGPKLFDSEENARKRFEVVRRLDWRFLLPDPGLRRVGFVGPDDSDVAESLKLFSQEFVILNREPETRSNDLDLLVFSGGDLECLRIASARLVTGCHLYAEWRTPKLGQSCRSFEFLVRKLGFVDLKAHWHLPGFADCLSMVPLDSAAALQHVFSRNLSGFKGYAFSVVGRILLSAGLVHRAAKSISLVGHKA